MVNEARLMENFAVMNTITASTEGITRLSFSDEHWQAREFVIKLMKEAGLAVRSDAFGNVIGRREGSDPSLPPVMTGSHVDSVLNGGNFDGTAGVLCAIEAIHCLNEMGFVNEHPLEIVVFMGEESSRFAVSTLGSKAMCGHMDVATLRGMIDEDGVSLYEAMKRRSLSPDDVAQARYSAPIKAFIEVHIEQGKVLETRRKQLGVVTGIAGAVRAKATLIGQADHSGATPMDMRRDALCAAAEIILAVERFAAAETGVPVVGTVGVANVSPGAINVVPGTVELGFDVRSIDAAAQTKTAQAVFGVIKAVGRRRDIQVEIAVLEEEAPVALHPALTELMCGVCGDMRVDFMKLPSGAGHDAMLLAPLTPTGMLFIPCRGGVSHNAAEWSDPADIARAAEVLCQTLRRLTQRGVTLE